jgi:hypothetical protein
MSASTIDTAAARSPSVEVDAAGSRAPAFTIATLVNDEIQYAEMQASFRAHGFAGPDVEFLAVRGARSAFAALNDMLSAARGAYIVLCHQDVRLIEDGRAALEARLAELEASQPTWALAGNAGAEAPGRLAIRITDPYGTDRHIGTLPARVMSLDENFIVVRGRAGLRFSRDLDGFHLYGADICLVADTLGWSAWVIDFHLRHLSPGRKDHTFREAEARFRAKWSRALRPRWMQTPCTLLHLTGSPLIRRVVGNLGEQVVRRLSRRRPGSAGWTPLPVPPAPLGTQADTAASRKRQHA